MRDILYNNSALIVLRPPQSTVQIEVMYADEMLWFSQKVIVKVFGTTVANVNMHLKNILQESDIQNGQTIKDFLVVQKEGTRVVRRKIWFYNLDTVVTVGLRINRKQAAQFRHWAVQMLRRLNAKVEKAAL